jgi:hypothetical protein
MDFTNLIEKFDEEPPQNFIDRKQKVSKVGNFHNDTQAYSVNSFSVKSDIFLQYGDFRGKEIFTELNTEMNTIKGFEGEKDSIKSAYLPPRECTFNMPQSYSVVGLDCDTFDNDDVIAMGSNPNKKKSPKAKNPIR